ncbi:YopJ family acetyltransferase [Pectobacterium parvum]|uniref:Effector protein YopJ n=1 Tax=Pectobacterium parvum TaxID=2778550 RepID=A0AAP9LDT2_9GAMM|nr:YopJ family acetyltransferase [Pectobacterium parvum]QHQ25515.1 Effector protein YopJ [Pectobacterium parvum]
MINDLEEDLRNGTWKDKKYSSIDLDLMPYLVKQANDKNKDLNLSLVNNPIDLPDAIKNKLNHCVDSSRFIIIGGKGGVHFSVVDCRKINDKIYLVLFESYNFNHSGVEFSMRRVVEEIIFQQESSDWHFSIMDMDIQRSRSECGIFSLAIAKKLHKDNEKLLKMHTENISGLTPDNGRFLSPTEVDRYLPVSCYKHTQSRIRLDLYLSKNKEAKNAIVNKKILILLPDSTKTYLLQVMQIIRGNPFQYTKKES